MYFRSISFPGFCYFTIANENTNTILLFNQYLSYTYCIILQNMYGKQKEETNLVNCTYVPVLYKTEFPPFS